MNCPDIERLLDFADARESALDLAEHVGSCEECQLAVRILRTSAHAFEPDLEVPGHLVERVVEAARAVHVPERPSAREARQDAWLTGALAAGTALAAVVVTGAVGPGAEAVHFVLLSLVAAPVAYVVERGASKEV